MLGCGKPSPAKRDGSAPRRSAVLNSDCPNRGASLVLLDLLERPDMPAREIWYDKFICPDCHEGIHLDVPEVARELGMNPVYTVGTNV